MWYFISSNAWLLTYLGIILALGVTCVWYLRRDLQANLRLKKEFILNNSLQAEQLKHIYQILRTKQNPWFKEMPAEADSLQTKFDFQVSKWAPRQVDLFVENQGNVVREVIFKGAEPLRLRFDSVIEFPKHKKALLLIDSEKRLEGQQKIDFEFQNTIGELCFASFVIDFDHREIITEEKITAPMVKIV